MRPFQKHYVCLSVTEYYPLPGFQDFLLVFVPVPVNGNNEGHSEVDSEGLNSIKLYEHNFMELSPILSPSLSTERVNADVTGIR